MEEMNKNEFQELYPSTQNLLVNYMNKEGIGCICSTHGEHLMYALCWFGENTGRDHGTTIYRSFCIP